MASEVKYPAVKVKLSGKDDNAFNLMGLVNAGLRKAGVEKEERDKFFEEATAGSYNQLLAVCCRWVTVS